MFSSWIPHVRRAPPVEVWCSLLAAVLLSVMLAYALIWLLHGLAQRAQWAPAGFGLQSRVRPPVCVLIGAAVARFMAIKMGLANAQDLTWLNVVAIAASAWLIVTLLSAARHWLNAAFDVSAADNLRQRRIQTQFGFIEKILDVVVVVSATAAMLYQLPWGRTLGTSLLASAGVASLIIGFAAQRTIANLIAGFQLAFTQPMRIGDAVVVEDEWGWVEEISLTYVVVRIWDLRRLVLPITYFIEKPFQNWTRTSGQILGSVTLTVSHQAPFDVIEKRLFELLDRSERWDRDARVLQVIEWNERSVVMRALMTARDSPTCWDLRCEVRRGLLEFLVDRYPEALPVLHIHTMDAKPEAQRDSFTQVK